MDVNEKRLRELMDIQEIVMEEYTSTSEGVVKLLYMGIAAVTTINIADKMGDYEAAFKLAVVAAMGLHGEATK